MKEQAYNKDKDQEQRFKNSMSKQSQEIQDHVVVWKKPSSYTEGEQLSNEETTKEADTEHVKKEPKVEDVEMHTTPKPDKGKGIARDTNESPRNLVKASFEVCSDPDAPKATKEAKLLEMNKSELIKVVNEEAAKAGVNPKILTRIPGLECNRSLPEGTPFINNLEIKQPENGMFFKDVFGDEAFQRISDIRKADVETLLTYLVMASNISTPANQRLNHSVRRFSVNDVPELKKKSGALVGQGSTLIACLRIQTLIRRRPTEAIRVRLVILESCQCSLGLNIGSLYFLLILVGPRPNCEGTALAQKPDFVVSLDFASATGGFSVTLLISSYTKGWLSFIKRSDAAPVCYSKPLDSVKNWNDHFFWVDSMVFPLSVSLKSKILSKDPPPKLSQYKSEAREFLRTHTAPFWKFPEPFLCWVGISRYYTLDENSYPTFWDGDEGGYILSLRLKFCFIVIFPNTFVAIFAEMDLFAFIRHSDPTKVRVGERNLADRELKLLKMTEGRTVALDPLATAVSRSSSDSIDRLFDDGDDAGQEHSAERDNVQEEVIAKDASGVVVEKPQKKRKRKVIGDASGSALPPKKIEG
ncbi:hypothetical protein Tco_0371347 [Tanacetum coccineum]